MPSSPSTRIAAIACAIALGFLHVAIARAGSDREDWWASVQRTLEAREYEPSVQDGNWQAPNRAQNLRTCFKDDGVEISPRDNRHDEQEPWRWKWRPSSWGREGTMRLLAAVSPAPHGGRIEYRRDGLVEWYENRAQGVEQGFTIFSRPRGNGPIRITGAVSHELTARTRQEGDGVDFLDRNGSCVLRYDGLRAADARGRRLPARLVVTNEALAIVVDDRSAIYPIHIDPLMTSPAWSTEADRYAFYGYSVNTAGDVNGDGYSDVLVGAINYENGQYEEGRAFLFLGSANGLPLTPSWTAEGNQTIARFAQSVAPAGDVNGDGYDDVVVGAPQYDTGPGTADEGWAFLYLGSDTGLVSTPAWTAHSGQQNANFGVCVATAGDVNGDGYDDVLVGAMGWDSVGAGGFADEGKAYLYLGSASGLAANPAWTAVSYKASTFFGRSVATAGDVNGDGYADVIVGARAYSNGQTSEGKAFLYLGSANGLSIQPAWGVEGEQVGAELGYSVATAGDVNGDGFADVVVGARGYTNGQQSEGRALLFLGSASGLRDTASWTAESDDPGGQFGSCVAPAGDINGDGYADVVIGSPLYGVTTSRGRAFAYLGSATGLAPTPFWYVESDQDDASFGFSVAGAGDVNGDGFADVIVGAPLYDHPEGEEGRAFLYLGSAAGPGTAAWTAEGNQAYSYFGYSVASAGDVNGDGYSDVLVTALYYDNGETDEGRVFLFLGSAAGLSPTAAWTAEGDQASAHFGQSVASAGDVNGDGYGDVIIGAHQYDDPDQDEGRAYLYLGSPSGLQNTPAWTAECDQALARFGISVASAGDVNGDGYADVIVGAMYFHSPEFEEGRTFVYYGSASGLSPTPSWTAESNQGLAFFGYSVASAGDVNGDGYSDVIVGAYAYDHGQTNEGGAFVYLGSPAGLAATPAWTAESNQMNGYLGFAVAGAGDVNGDGYSDVIVSSIQYDSGETDEGKVFVYLGSDTGLVSQAAWSAEGNQASSSFGSSVASAGDVNGDGYSDVVIGASAFDNPQMDEGRAFVYLGSDTGLAATPVWTAESDEASANFGISVASAGDVNGDGFADVIVGAPYKNGDLFDEGRAYLYYGDASRGLDRRPSQAEADGIRPIAPLGKSASAGFALKALGRSPAGRDRVRMEWQVAPLGGAFTGSPARGPQSNTGAPVPGTGSAVSLTQLVDGLQVNTGYHWRLRIASHSPFFKHSAWLTLAQNGRRETDLRTGPVATAVGGTGGVPSLRIESVRPNPSSTDLAIRYALPAAGPVRITIHDLQGRRVATLRQRVETSGAHTVSWQGRDDAGTKVRSGVYWARIEAGRETRSTKIVRF